MAEILTQGLVEQAIDLLRPTIREILENKDFIWGPKWVEIVFSGLAGVYVEGTIGYKVQWDPEWGEEKDFLAVAGSKHDLSHREKMSGSEIVLLQPWRLQCGDWIYSGSVYSEGFTCGVSGAKGEVDEMIAHLIIETVKGLCILRRRTLQENGVKQLC
jgi:hypothetical protein